MTQSMQLTILGNSEQQMIEWPILESRPKAIRVATPGGAIWLPRWRFEVRRYSVGRVDQIIRLIDELTGDRSDALVRIFKSGRGPTERSHRFKVDVIQLTKQFREGTHELRRRSYLLPMSQIVSNGQTHMAPRWLFHDKVAKDERIPRGTWPGLPAIREQIDDAVKRIGALEREAVIHLKFSLQAPAEERRAEAAR